MWAASISMHDLMDILHTEHGFLSTSKGGIKWPEPRPKIVCVAQLLRQLT